jgi:predicted Zn-dependent protease
MEEFIKVEDIYDKNLNFLLGSGASAGRGSISVIYRNRNRMDCSQRWAKNS